MQQHEATLAGVRGSAAKFLRQRPEVKRNRDFKKILLIAGLAALSWLSTYTGMLELIQANLGDLDIVFKIAIGASVAMLMLMVVWLLDQMFNEPLGMPVKVLYITGYLFLSLISVGFSFGFYWKFLESRSEASRGAESAVTQVQGSLHAAESRLDQMALVFSNLAAISTQKATDEQTKGNSCPNSRPGDGPRRRLRDSDAASFSTAGQFVEQRSASIKKDIASLDADLQKIVKQDASTFDAKTGTRNDFIKGMGRKMELITAGYNAFRTDPQLLQLKSDFAARADKTVFPDEQGKTFVCPDAAISSALKSAVKAIESLPPMGKPEITTVEGADATIEAFRRLNTTLLSLAQFKLPSTPDQIRGQQARAIQTGGVEAKSAPVGQAGLSERDYIPLAIAVFVDLCLLLVSIPKPLTATERTRRRRAQSDGEVYRTLDDMYAIHDDPDARAKMEPLRHIAFDYMGHDYVAIPLIAGRDGAGGDHDGSARNLNDDDMLEAQFMANFFSSQESGGPFRRASFPPASVVRARLKQLGSKWAGIQTFRVYRFKKGAWSDFVMDMVVGADKELAPVREKQLEARIKKNEMKSSEIVFKSELMEIEHDAVKSAKRKEAELNTLMIETNITSKQHEADLRRREISAQSELNTLGLEASITAKRAEVERQKREISRTFESDLPKGRNGERIELRAEGGQQKKAGFWDKLMGHREELISGTTEPTLERKPSVAPGAPALKVAAVASTAASPESVDIAALRDTVSELALVVKDLANRTAAAKAPLAEEKPPVNGHGFAQHTNGFSGQAYDTPAPYEMGQRLGNPRFDGYAPTQPQIDAGSPVGGTAHAGEGTVIPMPNLTGRRDWNSHDQHDANGYHSNGNAAYAYEQNDLPAEAPQQVMPNLSRRLEGFRWAAESTMAGGVHQIDRPIEPMVREAIPVDGHSDMAPELEETWQHMTPASVSSPLEIEAFIEDTRLDPEEAGEEFAEEPADRDSLEIERIATKFGRGGNRRRRVRE